MQYDANKYRKYDWKHFTVLHWIINPGLAFNELVFGQRVPKVMLVERNSNEIFAERTKVLCPHCNTVHPSKIWGTEYGTGYKNWFGLYCPECGGIIPCLTNATTFLILAVTSPLWIWFRPALKKAWLKRQPTRYQKLDLSKPAYDKKSWWVEGIVWGIFMFAIMNLLDVATGDFNPERLPFSFLVWMIGGLLFGLVLRYTLGASGKKKKALPN